MPRGGAARYRSGHYFAAKRFAYVDRDAPGSRNGVTARGPGGRGRGDTGIGLRLIPSLIRNGLRRLRINMKESAHFVDAMA